MLADALLKSKITKNAVKQTVSRHFGYFAFTIQADNGNRTRLPSLGSWCSTDELYLHTAIIVQKAEKNKKFLADAGEGRDCLSSITILLRLKQKIIKAKRLLH